MIPPCCLETQRDIQHHPPPHVLFFSLVFPHSCCELITATLFSGAPAPRPPEKVAAFCRLVPLQFCNRGDFSSPAPQPAVIVFNPTLTSFPAADPLLAEAMNQSPRAGDSWRSAGQEGCRKTSVYWGPASSWKGSWGSHLLSCSDLRPLLAPVGISIPQSLIRCRLNHKLSRAEMNRPVSLSSYLMSPDF